jgi:hypothetical protein
MLPALVNFFDLDAANVTTLRGTGPADHDLDLSSAALRKERQPAIVRPLEVGILADFLGWRAVQDHAGIPLQFIRWRFQADSFRHFHEPDRPAVRVERMDWIKLNPGKVVRIGGYRETIADHDSVGLAGLRRRCVRRAEIKQSCGSGEQSARPFDIQIGYRVNLERQLVERRGLPGVFEGHNARVLPCGLYRKRFAGERMRHRLRPSPKIPQYTR